MLYASRDFTYVWTPASDEIIKRKWNEATMSQISISLRTCEIIIIIIAFFLICTREQKSHELELHSCDRNGANYFSMLCSFCVTSDKRLSIYFFDGIRGNANKGQ